MRFSIPGEGERSPVLSSSAANRSRNPRSVGFLVFLLVVFVIWEFLSHLFMKQLGMGPYHLLSVLVETALAITITGLAVRSLSQKNKSLEEQIFLRKTMSQMLVHDLRNPLTGLLVSLNTLRRRPSEEVAVEVIDLSLKSAIRLRELIDDVLDIARLEELEDALDIEETSEINNTLSEISDYAIRVAAERGIRVEVGMPPVSPTLALDLRRFRRVLENLISNAIKHTPPEGLIRLKVTFAEGFLKGEVSDSGPGVPVEDRERVFGKFEMVQQGSRSSSGLGLAFCRSVIEGHGGRIWLEESSEGGCSFQFQIPMKTPKTNENVRR
jgi:two-component system, sensor histidine kinase and response regulator